MKQSIRFFQNEVILVQLNELDEFPCIKKDLITASYKHRKHCSAMVRVADR